MASIGGLSGTTSSSLNGLKGYGGLASGLDRDSLIEGMTQGTTSKIYKQQQKRIYCNGSRMSQGDYRQDDRICG